MGRRQVSLDSVICTSCLHQFESAAKLSLLGFRTYVCPQCDTRVYYPLRRDHLTLFVLVLILGAWIMLRTFASGEWAVPGVIMVLGVFAVFSNHRIGRRIAEAKRKAGA